MCGTHRSQFNKYRSGVMDPGVIVFAAFGTLGIEDCRKTRNGVGAIRLRRR